MRLNPNEYRAILRLDFNAFIERSFHERQSRQRPFCRTGISKLLRRNSKLVVAE